MTMRYSHVERTRQAEALAKLGGNGWILGGDSGQSVSSGDICCQSENEKSPVKDGVTVILPGVQSVEAAGFEPASRDGSTEASTCVVVDLNFAL